MSNPRFLYDLALIIDILEELSILSNALQAHSATFQKADKLVRHTVRALSALKDNLGCHEEQIQRLIQSEAYKKTFYFKTTKVRSDQRLQDCQEIS